VLSFPQDIPWAARDGALEKRPQAKPVPFACDTLPCQLVEYLERASELLESEFVQLGQALTEALSISSLV
jgi:hypothetical protein